MRGKLSATQIMDYTSQINTRAEQMAQAWRRVKIEGGNYELNKAKFEVEADKIYQEKNLREWIYGGVNAGASVIKAIGDYLPWKKVINILTKLNK